MMEKGFQEMVLRHFQPKDLSQVMELNQEVRSFYDPELIMAFYQYHHSTSLVMEHQGMVIGYVVGFKPKPLEGRVFWIAVRPAFQGQGVGQRLLIAVMERLRRLGAIAITLEVRIGNRNAQALYTSMGFEGMGIIPNYYQDGAAALLMRRRL